MVLEVTEMEAVPVVDAHRPEDRVRGRVEFVGLYEIEIFFEKGVQGLDIAVLPECDALIREVSGQLEISWEWEGGAEIERFQHPPGQRVTEKRHLVRAAHRMAHAPDQMLDQGIALHNAPTRRRAGGNAADALYQAFHIIGIEMLHILLSIYRVFDAGSVSGSIQEHWAAPLLPGKTLIGLKWMPVVWTGWPGRGGYQDRRT